MPEWFYRYPEEGAIGPVSPSQLLELIRQGQVVADTLIRKDDSPWVRACEVNGLWQAAGRPDVEFECPHCGRSIEKPPVRCRYCNREVKKAVGHLVHVNRPRVKADAWMDVKRTESKPKAPPLQ